MKIFVVKEEKEKEKETEEEEKEPFFTLKENAANLKLVSWE